MSASVRIPHFAFRILVVGLGIEGVALTRYFAARGADVTVNDARAAAQLTSRVAELDGVPFRGAFGGHEPALLNGIDSMYVSQGVPLTLPLVAEARRRGIPVGSITTLLFDICKGRIVGVTGSAGKTTTTSLVAAIVARSGLPSLLAGNIGRWPLAELERVSPDTLVVVELSHTQLQLTDRSPHVACVTNVTPNHLDQFTWDEYVALKTKIFAFQRPDDTVVFNADDRGSAELRTKAKARQFLFSMAGDPGSDGGFTADGTLFWRREGDTEKVVRTDEIPLRGAHNVANAAAAVAIAAACGIDPAACRTAILGFRAPSHRIEPVGCAGGVTYYDDSIATTPERTLAALRSFEEPIILLLGGRDKNLPLEDLVAEAGHRCRAAVCFGEAGPLYASALAGAAFPVETVAGVPEAVAAARAFAWPGDAVLLSPAGTSFDAYPNFERRGDHFRALVAKFAEPMVLR